MILYKYRTDCPYTEDIFLRGRVWLATAEQLNDPFECSIQDIAPEWIEEKEGEAMQAQLAGFISAAAFSLDRGVPFFGQTAKQTKKLLRGFRAPGPFPQKYKAFRVAYRHLTGGDPSDPRRVFRNLDSQLQAVGIFSMSRQAAHPLMWAHYSANHTGLAIGFEAVPGSPMADPERCVAVDYRDSIPKFSRGPRVTLTMSIDEVQATHTSEQRISFADATVRAAIRTKATAWAYEEEWRYLEQTAGSYPWPGLISEIVFGLRCTEERRAHYRTLIAKVANPVVFHEIAKTPNTNALVLTRLAD